MHRYAVEMRTGKSPRWQGLGLVNGTSVKKKNLSGREGYHFRVKPLGIGAVGNAVGVVDACLRVRPAFLGSRDPPTDHNSPTIYPNPDIVDAEWAWSPGSEALSPLTLAPHIRTLLGSELVGKDGAKVPMEALAGKVVGALFIVYFLL